MSRYIFTQNDRNLEIVYQIIHSFETQLVVFIFSVGSKLCLHYIYLHLSE